MYLGLERGCMFYLVDGVDVSMVEVLGHLQAEEGLAVALKEAGLSWVLGIER